MFIKNWTTFKAILFFFVCIFLNFGGRALWIPNMFFRQELSNEDTIRFVRQFWIFHPILGVADLFGGRGDQNSKENRRLWSACFWHDMSRYICLPTCMVKEVLFGGQPSRQIRAEMQMCSQSLNEKRNAIPFPREKVEPNSGIFCHIAKLLCFIHFDKTE